VTVTDAGGGEALVTIPGGGGGGSVGPWTLVASWIWSSNVTFVDLTGFGSYTDLYIVSEGLAVASSSARFILFSVDGGATFFTTNQYINISNIGQRISENQAVATAASAAVRDVLLIALGAGKISTRKPIQAMTGDRFFIGSDQPINAIRLLTSPVVNLTGGSIFVYAR
jgi:hypothetical protein